MATGHDRLLRRALTAMREGVPPRELFWRTLAVLGIRRLRVFVQPPGSWESVDWPPDIEARALSHEAVDVDAYCRARPDTPAAEVRRRLSRGDRCVALWKGDRIVASRWMSTCVAEIAYLGVAIRIPPGVEHHYDTHTVPDERGRSAQRLLNQITFDEALDSGRAAVFYTMGPENRAMLSLRPPASRRIGTVASLRLGRLVVPVTRKEEEGWLQDVRPLGRASGRQSIKAR